MAILVNQNTRVLVQGITGREGMFHTQKMIEYGTKIVAGVTPGKGGEKVFGIPVYDSVEEALAEHPEINTSIIFVPSRFASDAAYEAINSKIKLVVIITEGIPVHEELRFIRYAKSYNVNIVGPNTPGIITPGVAKVGILPARAFKPGRVGIMSRSGTLTYEIAEYLSSAGIGQSTVVGLGGDPINGLDFIEAARLFEEDEETDIIVAIGEIGGDAEERLAKAIEKGEITKPVVAYIAGRTAPPGKRMGHAGAIISMGMGTAESKINAFKSVGVKVAETPMEIVNLVKSILKV